MLVPLATVLFPLRGADRPVLSGPEEVLDAPPFRLHYTREGRDAPPDTDEDGDGVPDLVTTYREALLCARDDYAAEGWRPLATDGGAGGGDDIDVYVQDIDVFGYATPVPLPDGTASCHLRLDPANAIGGSIAAAVATHELHHCVQFRYTLETATWLYEASATYEQYSQVVDPVLELPVGVLWAQWLGDGETRLAATDGRREYAAFVFVNHWMQRRGADPARLPALWEALAAPEPGSWIPTLDREARRVFGVSLGAVWLDQAVWNAFACADDDGAHYDPDVIPCVAQVGVDAPPFVDGERIRHEDGPFTAAWRTLEADGSVGVRCLGAPGLRAALVTRDADGAADQVLPLVPEGRLVVPDGGSALVVVAGTDAPLDATCTLLPSSEGPGTGCAHTPRPEPGAWGMALALWISGRRRRSRRPWTPPSPSAWRPSSPS